jgi:hypothetical protein
LLSQTQYVVALAQCELWSVVAAIFQPSGEYKARSGGADASLPALEIIDHALQLNFMHRR